MLQKSQHTRYEEIILGRFLCEEAPQVVSACFKANLVDDPPCNATNDVPNEEEARNPGPEKEVDLYRVARRCPVHHLGDGHTREGQPAAHYGSSEGNADCS